MIRWAELHEHERASRFSRLSEFLTASKIENEFRRIPVTGDQRIEMLGSELADVQAAHISWPLSERVDFFSPKASREILNYEYADALVRDPNQTSSQLWPQSFLVSAFPRAVSGLAEIDTSKTALVFGNSGLARVACVLMSRIGFRNILCVSPAAEKLLETESMKRWLFGVDISCVGPGELMKLPSVATVMVLATAMDSESQTWEELAYCNYLMKEALVLNFGGYAIPQDFRAALQDASTQVIDFEDMNFFVDSTWVELIGKTTLKREAYLEFFRSHA